MIVAFFGFAFILLMGVCIFCVCNKDDKKQEAKRYQKIGIDRSEDVVEKQADQEMHTIVEKVIETKDELHDGDSNSLSIENELAELDDISRWDFEEILSSKDSNMEYDEESLL